MTEKEQLPELSDITEAYKRIQKLVHHTPILRSASLNKLTECDLYFKCENFQRSGAFKFRGACNALSLISSTSNVNTVSTHSSGNHAGALALAASIFGFRCIVVMPDNSPEVKINAVREYGARIIFCASTLQAREAGIEKVMKETESVFIHPYNDARIIAGQGTATLEILEDMNSPDIIVAPVGGGGLLSGTSIAAKSMHPGIKVYGAEPIGADDAFRSMKEKRIVPSVDPKTIADGLLTSLGTLTFKAISENVDEILTVSEKGIRLAMRLIWERMKIVAEPSACVPLAAIIEHKSLFKNKKVAIILSGGNVEPKVFQ